MYTYYWLSPQLNSVVAKKNKKNNKQTNEQTAGYNMQVTRDQPQKLTK